MQTKHILFPGLGFALAMTLPAIAGSPIAESAPASGGNSGDWCTWLANKPGMLYKNAENPWLQEFQLEGRFQYQVHTMTGEGVTGKDFEGTGDEFRRVRLGFKSKFLQYLGAKVVVNLVDDARNANPSGDLDWGYSDFDEAYLYLDLNKTFGGNTGFDTLQLAYGRHKFVMSQEARASSTKLLTVERSAISNKVYGSYRPTGLALDGEKGPFRFTAALYSSSLDGADNEFLAPYSDGLVYYGAVGYQVNDQLTLGADLVYNGADVRDGEDSVIGYEWATSLNAQYDLGQWGVIGDFIYGDNGDSKLGHNNRRDGGFWGVVVMPYYWILEDKLQLVGQYQYQASDSPEGVRVNSRYGRDDEALNVNSGRGDSHHSLYAGLNYYICGHNAKIQGGYEYQTMDTPRGDFHTSTWVLGFRTYF